MKQDIRQKKELIAKFCYLLISISVFALLMVGCNNSEEYTDPSGGIRGNADSDIQVKNLADMKSKNKFVRQGYTNRQAGFGMVVPNDWLKISTEELEKVKAGVKYDPVLNVELLEFFVQRETGSQAIISFVTGFTGIRGVVNEYKDRLEKTYQKKRIKYDEYVLGSISFFRFTIAADKLTNVKVLFRLVKRIVQIDYLVASVYLKKDKALVEISRKSIKSLK
jgi:hypothetical protein